MILILVLQFAKLATTLKSSGMTFVKGNNCRIFAAVIGIDFAKKYQKRQLAKNDLVGQIAET